MNPKVEEYLEKELQEEQTQRERHLISLGLYEKKFSPDGDYSKDYPEEENNRYYCKVALQVTGEEYAKICQYHQQGQGGNARISVKTTVKLLQVAAWCVYIGGLIYALLINSRALWGPDWGTWYQLVSSFLHTGLRAFAGGTLLLGMAKIVSLLDTRNKRQA